MTLQAQDRAEGCSPTPPLATAAPQRSGPIELPAQWLVQVSGGAYRPSHPIGNFPIELG